MRAWLLLIAACTAPPPEVTPLSGPAPANILLVPAIRGGGDRSVVAALDATLHGAMVERGYYAIPVEVALRILDALNWSPDRNGVGELPLETLRRRFGVESVLTTDVRTWGRSAGVDDPGRYEVAWRLIGTENGEELWSHSERGEFRAATRMVLVGPFFSDEPILGRDYHPYTAEVEKPDGGRPELQLQRAMVRHLPVGPLHPDRQDG